MSQMLAAGTYDVVNIQDLSVDEVEAVGGALSRDGARDLANGAAALGMGAALIGAEPVAAFLYGFAGGMYVCLALSE